MRGLIAVVLVASLFIVPAESAANGLLDPTFILDEGSPWSINNVVPGAISFTQGGDGVDLTAHGFLNPSTAIELGGEDEVVTISFIELNDITSFNGIVYLALYGGYNFPAMWTEIQRAELFFGEQTVKFRIRFGAPYVVLGAALVGPVGAKIRITGFHVGPSFSGNPSVEMDVDPDQFVFPPVDTYFMGGQISTSVIDGERRTCHTTTHGAYASGYDAAYEAQSYCCLRKGRIGMQQGAKCLIGGCSGTHCHSKQAFMVSSDASVSEGTLCYADCLQLESYPNNEYEYKMYNTHVALYDINLYAEFASEMDGVGYWSGSSKACHTTSETPYCCQLKGKVNSNLNCQFADCESTQCGLEYPGFFTASGETPMIGDTCYAKCWTLELEP